MAAAIAGAVGGSALGNVTSGLFNFFQGRETNAANERISAQTNATNERMNQFGYDRVSQALKTDKLPQSLAFIGNNSQNSMVPNVRQMRAGSNSIVSNHNYSVSNTSPMIGPYMPRLGVGKTPETKTPTLGTNYTRNIQNFDTMKRAQLGHGQGGFNQFI